MQLEIDNRFSRLFDEAIGVLDHLKNWGVFESLRDLLSWNSPANQFSSYTLGFRFLVFVRFVSLVQST